jgi:osmoprotectant transport system ATP-binding protein
VRLSASDREAGSSSVISLDGVAKSYGGHVALAPLSLDFAGRTTSVLIGPSGCGKSTLLRLIVGLVRPDCGEVRIGDETLHADNMERLRHGIGYVIQEGGLFPHLTAGRNVALLAGHLNRSPAWIAERSRYLAELMRIPATVLSRFPGELSGGQRQRVSLMRALMLDPPVLLLDEPLGALDPVTRFELQEELKRLFDQLAKTVVLVTHDMNEAAYFGARIVLLRAGRVVQAGSFDEFLSRPAERYVTEFIRAQRPLPATAT